MIFQHNLLNKQGVPAHEAIIKVCNVIMKISCKQQVNSKVHNYDSGHVASFDVLTSPLNFSLYTLLFNLQDYMVAWGW